MALAELILLIVLAALLVGSAFFSGSETALFSLSLNDRRRLASQGITGAAAARLLDETRGLLITLLLGNMTVNVLFFVISTVLLFRVQRDSDLHPIVLAALSALPLLSVILLGEVIPKLIASRLARPWSLAAAIPLTMIHRGIGPLRVVLNLAVIEPLARLIAPNERPETLSAHDLASLLRLSRDEGVIDQAEQDMLEQVLSLSSLKVRDVMTPRVDMHAFDLDDPPAELDTLIRKCRHSRIPVYRGDLDHIHGVVYARQVLLRQPGTRQQLRALVRNIRFVPEFQRADALMIEFRKTGTTMAIVVDEYGGTAGLVTLEDVVEHMVGDIAGAHEPRAQPTIQTLAPDRWRVNADVSVHECVRKIGPIKMPRGVATLGGAVMAAFGRLPIVGESVDLGAYHVRVAEMHGRRLTWLTIDRERDDTKGGRDHA